MKPRRNPVASVQTRSANPQVRSKPRLQAVQSFRLSRVVAVAGFALISTGIALGVYYAISASGTLDAAYLSAVAGLITEFVSGVFEYLYNRTLQQLNRFHDRMISSQNVAISFPCQHPARSGCYIRASQNPHVECFVRSSAVGP